MTKPYGNPSVSKVLVIGHDPRLQESSTLAEFAFFADYYFKKVPKGRRELAKYNLASSVFQYVAWLTSHKYRSTEVLVTNLCNVGLPRTTKNSTVLIPEVDANRGLGEITSILNAGKFEVIFAMSQQVNYWLHRLSFCNVNKDFLSSAAPRQAAAAKGAYSPRETSAFTKICGRRHEAIGVPLYPILHVKQYPLRGNLKKAYESRLVQVVNDLK